MRVRIKDWNDLFHTKPIMAVIIPYLDIEDCVIFASQVCRNLMNVEWNKIFQWESRFIKRFHHPKEPVGGVLSVMPPLDFSNVRNILQWIGKMAYLRSSEVGDEDDSELDDEDKGIVMCFGGCSREMYDYEVPRSVCKYAICPKCFHKRFSHRGMFAKIGQKIIRSLIEPSESYYVDEIIDNAFDVTSNDHIFYNSEDAAERIASAVESIKNLKRR